MAEERSELKLKWISRYMVASGVVAGAALGYFTTFVPLAAPLDIVVGGIRGGILLGVLPALAVRKWQTRNASG